MPYSRGKTYKPFECDEDQEMWVGEIDFTPKDSNDPDGIKHEGCVEVRADDEDILTRRVDLLIDALNSTTSHITMSIKR